MLLLITQATIAQQKFVPKSHFDENKWIEYIEGNLPLVISVPHGGRITVDTIPNCKGTVRVTDGNTVENSTRNKELFF